MTQLGAVQIKPIILQIKSTDGSVQKVICHFYTPAEDEGVDIYTCEHGKLRRTAMYNGIISVEEVAA